MTTRTAPRAATPPQPVDTLAPAELARLAHQPYPRDYATRVRIIAAQQLLDPCEVAS